MRFEQKAQKPIVKKKNSQISTSKNSDDFRAFKPQFPHIATFVIIVFVDIISKALVWQFPNLLNGAIKPQYNLGMAFSTFATPAFSRQMMIITPLVSIFLILALLRFGNKINEILKYALVVISAGALGNSIDRFAHFSSSKEKVAAVTDFIHYPFFTGNIADIAVVVGAVLAIIGVFKLQNNPSQSQNG